MRAVTCIGARNMSSKWREDEGNMHASSGLHEALFTPRGDGGVRKADSSSRGGGVGRRVEEVQRRDGAAACGDGR